MKLKRSNYKIITLECIDCRKNKKNRGVSRYITIKNKKNFPNKLELNKYCKFCLIHRIHKELK